MINYHFIYEFTKNGSMWSCTYGYKSLSSINTLLADEYQTTHNNELVVVCVHNFYNRVITSFSDNHPDVSFLYAWANNNKTLNNLDKLKDNKAPAATLCDSLCDFANAQKLIKRIKSDPNTIFDDNFMKELT